MKEKFRFRTMGYPPEKYIAQKENGTYKFDEEGFCSKEFIGTFKQFEKFCSRERFFNLVDIKLGTAVVPDFKIWEHVGEVTCTFINDGTAVNMEVWTMEPYVNKKKPKKKEKTLNNIFTFKDGDNIRLIGTIEEFKEEIEGSLDTISFEIVVDVSKVVYDKDFKLAADISNPVVKVKYYKHIPQFSSVVTVAEFKMIPYNDKKQGDEDGTN